MHVSLSGHFLVFFLSKKKFCSPTKIEFSDIIPSHYCTALDKALKKVFISSFVLTTLWHK